ncbi:MAG: aldo/keto reductase [Gammaproteobacteria bacterium]|nr:aldo/keto reductase [Gammaproteobacteria bacterium]
MMERIAIPASRVSISRLGLGCARLFGGREIKASAKLIEAALRAGVTHFDTAPAYGSEDVLGEVLSGAADVTIATKVGLPRSDPRTTSRRRRLGPLYRRTLRPLLTRAPGLKAAVLRLAGASGNPPGSRTRRRLTRSEVMHELEESLRRLRRESVDLYLLHEPDGIEITDELRELFVSLQAQGMVGGFGLAYGDKPDPQIQFGTATQCRFAPDAAREVNLGAARIYHGVLRFGLHATSSAAGSSPARGLIRQVLAGDPGCAVIFSASTERQIMGIAGEGE